MHSRSLETIDPSHRETLRAPRAKRREVLGESHGDLHHTKNHLRGGLPRLVRTLLNIG